MLCQVIKNWLLRKGISSDSTYFHTGFTGGMMGNVLVKTTAKGQTSNSKWLKGKEGGCIGSCNRSLWTYLASGTV